MQGPRKGLTGWAADQPEPTEDAGTAVRLVWSIGFAVAVCAVAGLAVAATILLHRAGQERSAFETRAVAMARATAHAADREIAAAVARLEALSISPALAIGDLEAIRTQLAATPTPDGTWFALREEAGQLVNTLRRSADAALPRDSDLRGAGMLAFEDIVRSGVPRVSPLTWGPAYGGYVIAVSLPARLGPEQRPVLVQTVLPRARVAAAVFASSVAPPWTVTVSDRNGRVIARDSRSGGPDEHPLPAVWRQRVREGGSEGVFVDDAPVGPAVLVAFAKPGGTDWTVTVDIPLAAVERPVREALTVLGLSALALLLLAGTCAWWLRRRIWRLVSLLRLAASEAGQREARERARFRHYWDHTPEGLFVVQVTEDGDFVFEGLNPAHARATGLTTADIAGRRPEDCLPAEVAAAVRRRYADCVRHGNARRYEETLDLPGGRRDWETSLAPMCDPKTGRVTALFGTCRDVTERLRAERGVRANEERLRLAQRAAGAGIWELDPATGTMHWSPEMYRLLGLSADPHAPDRLRDTWLGLVHPDDRGAMAEGLAEALTGGSVFDVDCRFFRADGSTEVRWMAIRGQLARHEGGIEPHLLGVAVDVTERRRAQITARETLALLHSSLDALTAQVAILDAGGRVVAANAPYWRSATRGPEPGLIDAAIRAVANDNVPEIRREYRASDPVDGRVRWFQLRVTRFGEGEGLRLVMAHEDITEVQRSTDALKRVTGRLLSLQDKERRRIALELHDTSVQDIAMAMVDIDMASAAPTEEGRAAALAEARDLLERAVRDIRTLSYLLHPPLLDELGLASALGTYAEGLAKRTGITCTLALDTMPPDAIPTAAATALFRVAQEAFANVIRHSGARRVRLGLRFVPGQVVELRVEDDGRGFSLGGPPVAGQDAVDLETLGVGIPGMRLRIRQLGGALAIETGEGGTRVCAMVPLTGTSAYAPDASMAAE
jgi:two-component system NarL family sensor kinase